MKKDILITNSNGRVGIETLRSLYHDYPNLSSRKSTEQIYAGISRKEDSYLLKEFQEHDNFHIVTLNPNDKDSEDYKTTIETFKKIKKLFIIPSTKDNKVEESLNFIHIAMLNDVPFVLMLSVLDPKHRNDRMGKQFLSLEAALAHSGLDHTLLRASLFMQNLIFFRDEILNKGQLTLPIGNGKVAPINIKDVGFAAARILKKSENHINRTYSVSGPQVLNGNEMATLFNKYLNKKVIYKPYFYETKVSEMLKDENEKSTETEHKEGEEHETQKQTEEVHIDTEKKLRDKWLNFLDNEKLNVKCPCNKADVGENEVTSVIEMCRLIANDHLDSESPGFIEITAREAEDFSKFVEEISHQWTERTVATEE